MTSNGRHPAAERDTQLRWARAAGFLFLWLIVTGLAGSITISRIVGSGTFAERAARVVASERLYRVALASELVETISAMVLAFALFATLRPVGKLLAQMAMYWRLIESFVGCVGIVFGFCRLRIYLGPPAADQAQGLIDLTRYAGAATYNIGAMCFSIGSAIFFYLFYRSRYIPRALSILGVAASVLVTVYCFANLIVPEQATALQYAAWAPMALAEVATGIWLMIFAVNTQADEQRHGSAQVASVS